MSRHTEEDPFQSNRELVQSFKVRSDAKRTLSAKFADALTQGSGSMVFLILNFLWFAVWIIINTGLIPGIPIFDPFPFGLLTMIVSLEAIGLAIVVLISQNRAAQIADLREEVDLRMDMIAEEEITKLLSIVVQIAEKHGIDLSQDDDLQAMLEPTNTEAIEEMLENEIINGITEEIEEPIDENLNSRG
jgi:uncharacterized membrane protein